jgi:hypothetical protein
MRIYDLNNVDFAGESVQQLEEYLTEDIITEGAYLRFDPQNGVMILIDLPTVHEKVKKILEAVDRPARQVYVQAEIVLTSLQHSFSFGSDWQVADDRLVYESIQGGSGGNGGTDGDGDTNGEAIISRLGFDDVAASLNEAYPVVSGGPAGITLDYLSRHARFTFNAVMEDTETNLLAQPRLLVKNQQVADFTAGGTISYATTTYYGGGYYPAGGATGGYPYTPSVGSGSVPTGITLSVQPSVMNNGLIEMQILLTNIQGTPVTRKLGSTDYTLVDTTNQSVNSVLVIPDGQTRMIGGLIENRDTETVNGIPYLKDIPILGGILFGSKSREPLRRTLLMFITPTVIQEKARKYAEPIDDDERTPPTFYEEAEWSAAATKRAVEEALGAMEQEYPDFTEAMGRPEPKPTGRIPAPTPRLEHEATTETVTEREPSVGMRRPPTPAVTLEHEPTTGPVEIEPESPPPAERPPVESLPIEPPPAVPPDVPTSPPAMPAPPPEPEAPPEIEAFPGTGTVLLSPGPPREVMGARRPEDLALPPLPAVAEEVPAPAGVARSGETAVGSSSYDTFVLGPDGRTLSASPTGDLLRGHELGTFRIPMDTLATKAAPARPKPGARPGARRTPARPASTRPGARPTPARARPTPLRPTPGRPIRSRPATASSSSSGSGPVNMWGSPVGVPAPTRPSGRRLYPRLPTRR